MAFMSFSSFPTENLVVILPTPRFSRNRSVSYSYKFWPVPNRTTTGSELLLTQQHNFFCGPIETGVMTFSSSPERGHNLFLSPDDTPSGLSWGEIWTIVRHQVPINFGHPHIMVRFFTKVQKIKFDPFCQKKTGKSDFSRKNGFCHL